MIKKRIDKKIENDEPILLKKIDEKRQMENCF
jgi:hypothetical protein